MTECTARDTDGTRCTRERTHGMSSFHQGSGHHWYGNHYKGKPAAIRDANQNKLLMRSGSGTQTVWSLKGKSTDEIHSAAKPVKRTKVKRGSSIMMPGMGIGRHRG